MRKYYWIALKKLPIGFDRFWGERNMKQNKLQRLQYNQPWPYELPRQTPNLYPEKEPHTSIETNV
jgi:hypothetical protein